MIPRSPTLTLSARLLIRGMEATSGWPRERAIAVVALLLGSVIALDWLVGAPFNMNLPYLVVCAFAVWWLGEREGLIVALIAAVAAATLKHQQLPELLHRPLRQDAELWNIAARTAQFGLFVVVVSGLKGVIALEQWGAAHDDLTGALNKAGFRRTFDGAITRMQAREGNLLFAFMDLDGFKGVNDQHGHASGDLVLRAFADAARASIRPGDHFARIGGDEFAMLLSLPGDVDGGRVAELLHQRLTALLGETGYDVTCSMGAVAVSHTHAASPEALIDQADALMYESKRAGKNTLRISRGGIYAKTLHSAYPTGAADELDELLHRIDRADRTPRWALRRAA